MVYFVFQFAKLLKKGLVFIIINNFIQLQKSIIISKINNQNSSIVNQNHFSSIIAAVASNHEITLIGDDFKGNFLTFIKFHC